MVISNEKIAAIEKEMAKYGISQDDLIEKFILGSGSGGQKVNKTHSCVYLKHLPTGTEIKCQKSRYRETNRYYARKELIERIKRELFQIKTKKEQERAKIKRQKKRRSRKQQQKVLEAKKQRSEIKKGRQRPSVD